MVTTTFATPTGDRDGRSYPGGRVTESKQELAARSGLGMTLIADLIRDGRLDSVKVGRRRLIIVASSNRLLGLTADA